MHVYFIEAPALRQIKIGYAADAQDRLWNLQTGSPTPLRLLRTVSVACLYSALMLEARLHQRFQASRLVGEWFRSTPELLDCIARAA